MSLPFHQLSGSRILITYSMFHGIFKDAFLESHVSPARARNLFVRHSPTSPFKSVQKNHGFFLPLDWSTLQKMPGRVHFARQYLTLFALKIQQNLALSFERDQVQRDQMGPAPFSDPGFIERLPSEVQRRGGGGPGLQELQGKM
jgi:hypothetical protein